MRVYISTSRSSERNEAKARSICVDRARRTKQSHLPILRHVRSYISFIETRILRYDIMYPRPRRWRATREFTMNSRRVELRPNRPIGTREASPASKNSEHTLSASLRLLARLLVAGCSPVVDCEWRIRMELRRIFSGSRNIYSRYSRQMPDNSRCFFFSLQC